MLRPIDSVAFDTEESPVSVRKFVSHSKRVTRLAAQHGWLPAARYTNLRDVRDYGALGFLDIDWKRYSFSRHLAAARHTRPSFTVARDVEDLATLPRVLKEADRLLAFAQYVIVVPKDLRLRQAMTQIPVHFVLGYSVPSRYGQTQIPIEAFRGRPVHLLGGRPDVQRGVADLLDVVSIDCNRFTLDAAYGDYFDGQRFRPHPLGGYDRCLADSLRNITALWDDYRIATRQTGG